MRVKLFGPDTAYTVETQLNDYLFKNNYKPDDIVNLQVDFDQREPGFKSHVLVTVVFDHV